MAQAGNVYGELLANLLMLETTRKASIEQRGITVITSSGVLVSLLIALSALLIGPNSTSSFGVASRSLIIAAVVIFVVAASFGIMANAPRTYVGLGDEDFDRMVAKHSWSADEDEAAFLIAQQRVRELKTAIKINNRKGDYVQWAITAQVIGVGLVAAAIIVALIM